MVIGGQFGFSMKKQEKTKVFKVKKREVSLKGSLKELGIDFLEGLKKGFNPWKK